MTITPLRVSFLLTSSILLVFGQVVGFEFVNFDDPFYIYNDHVKKGLTLEGIIWAFSPSENSANFLNWISHMVDVELFGFNPAGHHFVNLILHIINSILFFSILFKFTGSINRSAFAALIFAIHPLRVETVAWVSDRKDLLCMLFILFSLRSYGKFAVKTKLTDYFFSLLFFLFALLSKVVVFAFPVLLMLLDFWPFKRVLIGKEVKEMGEGKLRSLKNILIEKIPFALLSGIFVWITIGSMRIGGAEKGGDRFPLVFNFEKIPINYLSYLKNIFWPTELSAFYPLISEAISIEKFLLAFLSLVVITFLFFKKKKEAPYLLIGWLWFFMMLAPSIGALKFFQFEIADRYTYIPLVGIIIIFVWSIFDFFKNKGFPEWMPKLLLTFSVVVLMRLSFVQTITWSNNIDLYENIINQSERNYVAHHNLGLAWMDQGNTPKAIHHFNKAVLLSENSFVSWVNLGNAYFKLKNYKNAIFAYQKCLKIDPNNLVAHLNLGLLYDIKGEGKKAIIHSMTALEFFNAYFGADFSKSKELHHNLQNMLKKYGYKREDFVVTHKKT